jgi:putative ABC transport system permease protein
VPFWYVRRRPDKVASEIDEELRTHLDMRIGELTARGLSPEDARQEALRQFGDLEATRAYCRQQDLGKETHLQRGLLFQDLMQDLRISLRGLWRAPVLTLTIVATVGLGLGATTVIFAAVHAAFLRPLPYKDPGKLVRIYTDTPPFKFPFSVADYLALREQQTHFDQVAVYSSRSMTYSNGAVAELLRGRMVSSNYFTTLGIVPALGPGFSDADGRPGNPQAVIVTHGFWQQRLGGLTDVVGRPIRLDGTDYALRGVLPAALGPLERGQEFFVAQQLNSPPRKGPFFFTALARLKSESDRGPAADELRAINKRIFPIWKVSYQDDKATWSMMDLHAFVVGDTKTIAGLALAAVALVWLIACTNASNLLIARVTSRRRELAVRAALGASRGRVIRHLLVESALLAVGAVIVGGALAWAGTGVLQAIGATYFPRTQEIGFDGPVLWMMVALTSASALMFGLVPAVHGTGGPVDESLRSLGRSSTGSRGVQRLRRALVGSQFAIATPLLVVAGLLLVSLNALKQVDLGFDSRNILTGSMRLPAATYSEPARVRAFYDELKRRVEALPGAGTLAFSDSRPPIGVSNSNNFDLEEFPTPPGQSQPVTPWVAVTPDYFRVLGLTLIEGRLLEQGDAERENLESVVVDRAWARRFFPNQSAIGKRFREGGCTTCPWTSVVGIVSEVKYVGLDQPDEGTVYAPLNQPPARNFIMRTRQDAQSMLPSIRQVLRELDPEVPLSGAATMDELVAQSLERPQSLSMLVASFALVALVLSVVGIYGVMTYYVQQHSKDISIRLALGGTPGEVLRLILGQGMRVVSIGVVVGVLTALGVTRLMSSLLFGVGAADAVTFVAAGALLLTVALLACFVPARRGVKAQPAMVLRNE